MADIDIQQKKTRSVWPWLVGLLGLILVVWVAAEMLGRDGDPDFAALPAEEQEYQPAQPGAAAASPAEVERFEQECAGGAAREEMSLQHEYTQTCIRHMTAALDAVIQRDRLNDAPVSEQLEQYRSRAEQLTTDPESPEHSANLSETFNDAAALIARMEETRAGTGQTAARRADRVQEAADAFSPEGSVLDQREEVATFFREVAAALRAMTNGQDVEL